MALHIVNAANIQAQGNVTGVLQIQAPNIGGLTEAGNTAGAAAQQAANPGQSGATEQPSVIIVEVIGFGGGEDESQRKDREKRSDNAVPPYNPEGAVRILGVGALSDEEQRSLNEDEKKQISSGRCNSESQQGAPRNS